MKKTISFNSKFGWISIFEEKNKITKVKFLKTKNLHKSKILEDFKINLNNFFLGKTKTLKAPYKTKGNIMQKKIWAEIKKIKCGNTKSYGEIAKKFGISPRYVGRICGQNNLILLIPCHRVVRTDGKLGGFSAKGGILLKQKLLNFEKL